MNRILSVIMFFLSSAACASTFQPTQGRTFVYVGPVDGRASLFAGAVMQLGLQDPSQPIDILINSDGGDVNQGAQLIVAIDFVKKIGVDVRCVNMNHAISMGFMIMAHCSHRYATPSSVSMFHYPRVQMGASSSENLRDGAEQLKRLEDAFVKDLSDQLKRPEGLVRKEALAETMWTPDELNKFSPGFYEVVDTIQGVKMTLLFQ